MTNFRINGSRNIQEAQFFRAQARSFYDRGNRKTEVSFDVTRLFASQPLAEAFMLMHETQFPSMTQPVGMFLATFVAGISGQPGAATRYLQLAACPQITSAMLGACTTRHSYQLIGGVMTTTPT